MKRWGQFVLLGLAVGTTAWVLSTAWTRRHRGQRLATASCLTSLRALLATEPAPGGGETLTPADVAQVLRGVRAKGGGDCAWAADGVTPLDAWDHPLLVLGSRTIAGGPVVYKLLSTGPDGKAGSGDEIYLAGNETVGLN